MGLCFLTFFDTSKTEQAKTFPSFSDKPHDIVWQYHVGKGQGETGITILLQTTRMAVKMTMCVPVTYPHEIKCQPYAELIIVVHVFPLTPLIYVMEVSLNPY